MARTLTPDRIVCSKSFFGKNFVLPFKFFVEPKSDEWFVFGFGPNNFTGNQLYKINLETEFETIVETGIKKFVNNFDVHNPSDHLRNVQILEMLKIKNNKNLSIVWTKKDLFNEYCFFVRFTNNNDQNCLVTIYNIEWENLE